MNDSELLRNLVAQLLALALRARKNGDTAFSDELVAKAINCEDRASALEEMAAVACPALVR